MQFSIGLLISLGRRVMNHRSICVLSSDRSPTVAEQPVPSGVPTCRHFGYPNSSSFVISRMLSWEKRSRSGRLNLYLKAFALLAALALSLFFADQMKLNLSDCEDRVHAALLGKSSDPDGFPVRGR